MASISKYSTLSGIAWDQPDVYESPSSEEEKKDLTNVTIQDTQSNEQTYQSDKETLLQRYKRIRNEAFLLKEKFESTKCSNDEGKHTDPALMVANLEEIKSQLASFIEPKLVLSKESEENTNFKSKEALDRLNCIDRKINRLEMLIGKTTEEKEPLLIPFGQKKGIIDSIQTLSSRVEKLDVRALEAVDKKVTDILAKLSKISSEKGQVDETLHVNRIDELYRMITRSEDNASLVDEVAMRLKLLCELEEQCSIFGNDIKCLEKVQEKMAKSIKNNRKELEELKQLFQSNKEAMEKMISNIEKRIEALK